MALTKVDISLMDNATGFTIVTKIVTVAASKLVTDGVSQDTLILTEGYTYKFDTSHATMSGHTFSFATAADAAGSTQYTTGVTTSGTPGSANAYTQIIVAQSAPVLYYYCANHASMGGITSTPAAVIANKLLAYDGSGNLPVVDGSQLTGVPGATKSSSNPIISTNPSGGVGTEWVNTISGEVYICTDATAGANVWKNVGAGSGDVQPYNFQGKVAGYVATHDRIDEISFTSDGAATDVGDLATGLNDKGRYACGGNSSTTHGYFSGGYGPGQYSPNTADVIERMSFATKGTAVDVGNLVSHIRDQAGTSNETYGYLHAGLRAANDPTGAAAAWNVIWRFQYAASSNATDVGDLLAVTARPAGHSDPANSYGYCSAGGNYPASVAYNVIQRYAMSSSGNSSDVGDLTVSFQYRSGTSSSTHGYTAGCYEAAPGSDVIEKFAYGSSSNATDVGNLLANMWAGCGVSSTTFGYSCGGGVQAGPASTTNIDKYSFTTDGNATDVGDLSAAGNSFAACGAQV